MVALLIQSMGCSKVKLLSKMTQRLQVYEKEERVEWAMMRQNLRMALGQMMIIYDVPKLSLRKLVCILDYISVKQMARVR